VKPLQQHIQKMHRPTTHARTRTHTHILHLNDHQSNMLELHIYKHTYTYTTHNSKKKLHTEIEANRKIEKKKLQRIRCTVKQFLDEEQ